MIFKLFSQRNKAKTSEPLSYDIIPQAFRVQVVHILQEAVTDAPITRSSLSYYSAMEDEPSSRFWEIVFKSLTKELGVFKLNAHDTHYLTAMKSIVSNNLSLKGANLSKRLKLRNLEVLFTVMLLSVFQPANAADEWQQLTDTGISDFEKGNYSQAEQSFSAARKLAETQNNLTNMALSVSNLGLVFNEQARYKDSADLYTQAIEILERKLGLDDPNVAAILNDYAGVVSAQGQFSEAKTILERALRIKQKALSPLDLSIAKTKNDLACVEEKLGNFDTAESLYKDSLLLKEKCLQADDILIAHSLNNLACLYEYQKKYREAEPLILRAVQISEKTLGTEHPDVGQALTNLASFYSKQQRYSEAEVTRVRAMKILLKNYGPDHPTVAKCLNNRAADLNRQKNFVEAEAVMRQSLTILKKKVGSDHADIAVMMFNIAQTERNQGKYDQAELDTLSAVKILEKIGPNVPNLDTMKKALLELAAYNKKRHQTVQNTSNQKH